MTAKEIPELTAFLHTPARSVSLAMVEFKRRQDSLHRLDWGVPTMDKYLIPMMDGELVSLLARPGHTKTSTMIHLAKRGTAACHALADQGAGFDRCVVFATWETTVEEFIGLLSAQESGQTLEDIARGRADLEKIMDVAVANIGNRIYVIGKSSNKPVYQPITLQTIFHLLQYLREQGKRPILIALDYLQRIPASTPGMRKMEAVEDNVHRAKDLGLTFGCPTIMGVQAARTVDEQSGLQMPSMSDAQWSSAIEQDSDKLIGLTRPGTYLEDDVVLEDYLGNAYNVTDNMLAMRVLKQRWGRAGGSFLTYFNPALIKIGDFDHQDSGF